LPAPGCRRGLLEFHPEILYRLMTSREVARVGTVSCFFTTKKSGVGIGGDGAVEVPGAIDGEGGSDAEETVSSEVHPEKRIRAATRLRRKGSVSRFRMVYEVSIQQ